MIRISKISYKFYMKMIEVYGFNMKRYMNYEYILFDISRTYYLNYIKVDNLLWNGIDNMEHYNYIINKLLKRIAKKKKLILLENLKEITSTRMGIQIDEIQDILPIGEINYKIYYVLRVSGKGTEEMISRGEEIKNQI